MGRRKRPSAVHDPEGYKEAVGREKTYREFAWLFIIGAAILFGFFIFFGK